MKAQSHSFGDSTELERGLSFKSQVFYRQRSPGVAKCFRGTHIKTLRPKWHLSLQNAPRSDTQKAFKTYLLNRENTRWKVEVGVFNPSGRGVNLTAQLDLARRNTGDGV